MQLLHLRQYHAIYSLAILYDYHIYLLLLFRFCYQLLHHFFPVVVEHLLPFALDAVEAILFQLLENVGLVDLHYGAVFLIVGHLVILVG